MALDERRRRRPDEGPGRRVRRRRRRRRPAARARCSARSTAAWSSSPGCRTSSSRWRCRSSGRAARCSSSRRPAAARRDVAQGARLGLARHRVDPEGGRRPASSSSPSIWIPLRRSRLGLSIYAIGSNRLAAFRSGVAGRPDEDRRLRPDRACSRRSAAWRSRRAPASGRRCPGPYTLLSVAAVVLGGVSLAGGRGGVFGPIVAVIVLQLDPDGHDVPQRRHRTSRPSLQGAILIGVVMFGSLVADAAGAAHERAPPAAPSRDAPGSTAAAGAALFRDRPLDPAARACSASSSSSSSSPSPGSSAPDWVGDDHPGRRPARDPRRLPDADDADRRHRPVGRRRGLDGGVPRRDARRRPGPVGRDRSSRSSPRRSPGSSTAIGVGVFRVHPLIMTLGMSLVVLGLANVWQLLTVQTGAGVPPRSAGSAPDARSGSCPNSLARVRPARGAHPARPAADRLRSAAVRGRRQPDRGPPVRRPVVAGARRRST